MLPAVVDQASASMAELLKVHCKEQCQAKGKGIHQLRKVKVNRIESRNENAGVQQQNIVILKIYTR